MPSIDSDTFQLVTLGLLALIAIIELVSLISLSGIKKRLEGGAPDGGREKSPQLGVEAAAESGGDRAGSADPARTIDLEEAAAAARGDDVVSSYGTGEVAAYGAGGGAAGAMREAQAPVEQQPQQQVQQQAQAGADEPQEQPFERQGRWWFRRGDELLVYEERTGQWVKAPESKAPPASGQTQQTAGAATATQEQQQQSSFWKCPTCGAVNGSTALSCRMCFTQRPSEA